VPEFVSPKPKARPFAFTFKDNVLHAQAFGCWGYIQIGEYGLFLGQCCPWGFRFVWDGWTPRVSFPCFLKKKSAVPNG
jgi:hypothetical protein